MPISATYDVAGFPRAHDTIPITYRSLGNLPSLGRCVPVQEPEYRVLLGLDLEPVELYLSERAKVVLTLNTDNRALRDEISRLVAMIKQDVAATDAGRTGVNPMRFMPNDSDVFSLLM